MFKATLITTLMIGLSLASQAQVEALPSQKTKVPMSQMCIEDICISQTIGYMPASRARSHPIFVGEEAKAVEHFKALQSHTPFCKETEETVFLALPSGRLAKVKYSAFPLPTGRHMSVTSVQTTSPGNFTGKQISDVFDSLSARMKMKTNESARTQAMLGRLRGTATFMPWNVPAYLSVGETLEAWTANNKSTQGMEVSITLAEIDINDRLAAQPHCAAKTPNF